MTRTATPTRSWLIGLIAASACLLGFTGCPRNQTTMDDRTLEQKPHVETQTTIDREDPFRP